MVRRLEPNHPSVEPSPSHTHGNPDGRSAAPAKKHTRQVTPVERPSRRRLLQGGLAVASLGLISGCARLPLQSPRPKRIPRVGFLKQPPDEYVGVFQQAMREL